MVFAAVPGGFIAPGRRETGSDEAQKGGVGEEVKRTKPRGRVKEEHQRREEKEFGEIVERGGA